MSKDIEEFERAVNTKLTEREEMIFNYAYNMGKKELNTKDEPEIFISNMTVGYFKDMNFKESAESLARELGLECKIEYVRTVFGFPGHSKKYRVILKGKKDSIEIFCKLI